MFDIFADFQFATRGPLSLWQNREFNKCAACTRAYVCVCVCVRDRVHLRERMRESNGKGASGMYGVANARINS